MKANAKLKEQNEFSEHLEELERYKEQLIDKEAHIRALTEELRKLSSIATLFLNFFFNVNE